MSMEKRNVRGEKRFFSLEGMRKRVTSWLLVLVMIVSMLPAAQKAEAKTGMSITINGAKGFSFSFNGETITPDSDNYTYTFNSTNNTTYPIAVTGAPGGVDLSRYTIGLYSNTGRTTAITTGSAGYQLTTNGSGYWTKNQNGASNNNYVTSLTIYFSAKPKEYTITWNANGGTISGTAPTKYTYAEDGGVTKFPTATYPNGNRDFIGWYSDSALTHLVTALPDSSVDGNATLYAGYGSEYTEYKFYDVNGDLIDRQVIKKGDRLRRPEAPAVDEDKEEFLGWFDKASGKEIDFDTPSRFSSTVQVQAKVEPVYHVYIMTEQFGTSGSEYRSVFRTLNAKPSNSYKVTIPNDYQGTVGTAEYYYDSADTDPSKANGFIPTQEYTVGPSGDLKPNQELYPFLVDSFWVTFFTNGAENEIDSVLVANGNTLDLTKVNTPIKNKYLFDGWYDNPGFTGSALTKITPTSNVYLYAKYKIDTSKTSKYTIVYWGENADNPGYSTMGKPTVISTTTDSEIKLNNTTIALPSGTTDSSYMELDLVKSNITKSGKEYITGKKVTADDSTVINVFYKRIQYTIKADFSGKDIDTSTLPEGTATGIVYMNGGSAETRDAYAYYNATEKAYYLVAKKDQTFSGLWPRPYSADGTQIVKQYGNWATTRHSMTSDMCEDSSNYTNIITPTWTDASGKKTTVTYYLETLNGAEDEGATLHSGRFYSKINKYTETFVYSGSLSPKTITGYNTGSGSNNTFYYTRKSYKLNLVNYGDSKQYTTRYGEDITKYIGQAPARPTLAVDPARNAEYIFVGWFTVEPEMVSYDATWDATAGKWVPVTGSTEPFYGNTMPDVGDDNSTFTLYAYWWHPPVDIDINVNIISNNVIFTVPYEHSMTDVDDYEVSPGYNGYDGLLKFIDANDKILIHWADKYGNIVDPNKKLTEDTEIFAVFLDDGYTVTYDEGDATVESGESVPVDDKLYQVGAYAIAKSPDHLVAPADDETSDPDDLKVFAGWRNSINGEVYYPGESVPIACDVTLTAVWESNTEYYSITYYKNDTTTDNVETEKKYIYNEGFTQTQLMDYDDTGLGKRHAIEALGWGDSATAAAPLTEFRVKKDATKNNVYMLWSPMDEITISGTVVWEGDNEIVRPTSVDVSLYRQIPGGSKEMITGSTTAVTGDEWEVSYDGLPPYTTDDKEIDYTLQEETLDYYSTVITGNMDDGYVITNTFTAYLLTYDGLDGASFQGGTNPNLYTEDTETFTLINPTKYGYDFLGWSGTGISGTSKEVTIVKGSTGDRTYTANWEAADQEISFTSEMENETDDPSDTTTVPYLEKIKVVLGDGTWTSVPANLEATAEDNVYLVKGPVSMTDPTPAVSGTIFTGWTVTDGSNGITKVFTANYEADEVGDKDGSGNDKGDGIPDKYQVLVTYKVVNGTWSDSTTADITKYVTLKDTNGNWDENGSASVTKPTGMKPNTGYEDNNWSSNAETVTETTTFTYYFKATKYTITYLGMEGTSDPHNSTEYYVNSSAITLANPTKTGYTFKGWTGTGLSETTEYVTIPSGSTGNRTYTANWEANDQSVTYSPEKTGNAVPADDSITLKFDDVIQVIVTPGTWDMADGLTAVGTDNKYIIKGNVDLGKPTPATGDIFLGWDVTDGAEGSGVKKVFTALYETDTVGGKDGNGNDIGDGIPDKYQILVTYQIVYGTWSDDTTADITKYLTTKDDQGKWLEGSAGGTAQVERPTGMKADTGYENGTWDDATTMKISAAKSFKHTFTPIVYTITYNGLDGATVSGNPATYTIESNDITLTNPTKTGYTFKGWTGDGLTSASMSVTIPKGSVGNRTYTATWEADDMTISYLPEQKGDGTPDPAYDTLTLKFDDKIQVISDHGSWSPFSTLVPTTPDGTYIVKGHATIVDPIPDPGYVFLGWKVEDGTGDIKKVFTALYETDQLGDKDNSGNDKGDGIPDKYQVLVTYKVVHGTWDGTKTADITEYVTLKDNTGKWAVDGSAPVTKPTGMQADTGYENGTWDNTATTVTKATTFTYKYVPKDATITYPPEKDNDNNPLPEDEALKYDEKIQVIYAPGSWTVPNTLAATATDGVYIIKGNVDLGNADPKAGDVFLGWKVEDGTGDIKKVFTAQYETDQLGDKDNSGNDKGDGIPDKYQVLVTYKVVNGTWDAGMLADKKQYVTLKDANGKWSETGSAPITKPTGMVANTGYENGTWDDDAAVVTAAKTFTHSFTPITYTIDYEGLDGTTVSGNPDNYTIESDSITLVNPSKTGYTFKGWTGTDLASATMTVTIPAGSIGNRAYTATWEANDQTITYPPVQDEDGEPSDEDIPLKYDDKIQIIAAPGTMDDPDNLDETGTNGVYTVKGDVVLNDPIPPEGSIFIGWEVEDGTGDIKKVFTAQYETDKFGSKDGNGNDKGDGIPDKYQVLITYKVVNATWADATTADVTEYVTLKDKNGKWAVDGSAPVTKPAGMLANTGYENGAWDNTATTVTAATTFTYSCEIITYTITYAGLDGATVSGNPDSYTVESDDITLVNPTRTGYTFLGWTGTDVSNPTDKLTIVKGSTGNRVYSAAWEANEQKVSYSPEQTDDDEPDDEDAYVHYGDKIQIIAAPGTMDDPSNLEETGTDGVYTVKGDVVLKNPIPPAGSVFVGWTVENGTGTITKVFKAKYESDTLGGKDKDGNDKGDGIPDRYQMTFYFEVHNGTWADGTRDRIGIVATFYDKNGNWDENGTAYVDAPTGMLPDDGYSTGEWTPQLEYSKMLLASNKMIFASLAPGGRKALFTAKSPIVYKYLFTPYAYTITYENVDGAEMKGNPSKYTIVSDTIVLNNPTKSGYVFKGWTGTGLTELTMEVTIPKGSTGNRVFKANWERKDPEPPTGDHWNLFMEYLLLIAAGIAFTFLIVLRRRKKRMMS